MASLTSEQQTLIVERLACFYRPTEIQRELKELFSLDVGLSTIVFYDPNSAQGAKQLASEWKQLFAAVRERFIEDEASIAIASKSYRLRRLQQIIDDPHLSKNPMLVKDCLEQAAKEVGAVFTNRQVISGNVSFDPKSLSDEELEAIASGKSSSGT